MLLFSSGVLLVEVYSAGKEVIASHLFVNNASLFSGSHAIFVSVY